ncbi:MAG: hypothetical protein CL927_00905 [Deltaproteobacteria bacterium]|nr:hypothetical protein [Deltaproteobacteria bacterium]
MQVVFCHGLEGSPNGTKVRAMRAAGIDVLAPDFQGQILADRVETLRDVLAKLDQHTPVLLAGSSYGGAVAAWTAMHTAHPLAGLLLLAPALHYAEAPVPAADAYVPIDVPTVIIHGTEDTIVPLSASEAYAAKSPHVVLQPVPDGHRLVGSLDQIIQTIREWRR